MICEQSEENCKALKKTECGIGSPILRDRKDRKQTKTA
jgi:hypothetical protein